MSIQWVSDLIDSSNKQWNQYLLKSIFSPMEVSVVLNIQLSLYPKEDKIIWGGTKNGIFSVHSAYHLLKNRENLGLRNIPSSSRLHKWDLMDKNGIRTFLWKLCANGLANGENLAIQNLSINVPCRFCGEEKETSKHIMLKCPFAHVVWFGSPLSYKPELENDFSIANWLEQWLKYIQKDKSVGASAFPLASFICSQIWLARNDMHFHKCVWTPM
ncbi:hypothetical protein NE237_033072 [Protea cynaroides]|uniref:Reverse transcriptase zinc-binding domain-containing protein n=1 Tax=Protea cynaroides TaxID=273540 RepID=A0A9Q0L4T8_9MAGN|nr:hypothetical protein NE237_033072 [Protea cynaroides]